MGNDSSTREGKRRARSERRRQQTREEILDATRRAVLHGGLPELSLATVADELGLTTPALYYYFDSKEALVLEVLLGEWLASAEEIQSAVAATGNGADAVESLMRTAFGRYRDNLDLFRLVYMTQPTSDPSALVGQEQLERVRPVNDLSYGGAEARLRADQERGLFPSTWNPRRFAFTAHMAVIGVLSMKAITAAVGDPLIHNDDDLIDDLCRTFRTAATKED